MFSKGITNIAITILVVLVGIGLIVGLRKAYVKKTGLNQPQPIGSSAPSVVPSPEVTSGLSKNSIGYIGCSNTRDSVEGYHRVSNKGYIWESYETGGKSLEHWAKDKTAAWALYDGQVSKFGQPQKIWMQICEHEGRPQTYEAVKSTISLLKQKSPNAEIYLSSLNQYQPVTLCSFLGPDGVLDINAWVDQAVSEGLAKKGPVLGTLTVNNTQADRCHPNKVGENMLGGQLKDFFDAL